MAGVERIIAALASQPRHTATLAGCLIIAGPDVIDISREPGRNGLPQVPLEPGGSVLWDRRFTVRLPASARPGILIRPAKPADLTAEQKKLRLGLNVSQHIMETTPAAFRGNSLIACPVIGIMTEPIVFELALPDPSAGQANAVPHLTDE